MTTLTTHPLPRPSSPPAEVLRTYVSRWQMWLVWSALALYSLILLIVGYTSTAAAGPDFGWSSRSARWGWAGMNLWVSDLMLVLLLLGIVVALPAAVFTLHARETLVQWRSHLVPGHRPAHLTVAAAVFAAVVLYVPLAMWLATGMPLLGLTAFLTAVAAAVAWCEYLQTVRAALPLLLAAACLTSETVSTRLAELVLNRHPLAAALLLLAATLALAALARTLAHRTEPRDRSTLAADATTSRTLTASAATQRRLDRLRNVRHAGFRARTSHWRTVTGSQRVSWTFALAYAAILTAIPWLAGDSANTDLTRAALVIALLTCPLLVSSLAGDEGLWRRRGTDLLLPETRRRFVAQVLAASALDFAAGAARMILASLVPLLIWVPEFRSGNPGHWSNPHAPFFLLLTVAAAHVLFFGVQTALPRQGWKSLGPLTRLLTFTALTLAFFTLTLITANTLGLPGLLAFSALLTLLGTLLITAAYLNWTERDFE